MLGCEARADNRAAAAIGRGRQAASCCRRHGSTERNCIHSRLSSGAKALPGFESGTDSRDEAGAPHDGANQLEVALSTMHLA